MRLETRILKTIELTHWRLLKTDEVETGQNQPEKKKSRVIEELEEAAKNIAHKDWSVSQDDIHFCVHMLDNHQTVSR